MVEGHAFPKWLYIYIGKSSVKFCRVLTFLTVKRFNPPPHG
jgi:hypothetical protein